MTAHALEEWRSIVDWPSYEVSNFGRVRSLDRLITIDTGKGEYAYFRKGHVLKNCLKGSGPRGSYYRVTLSRQIPGTSIQTYNAHVHQLVAKAFIGEPLSADLIVAHRDGDSLNNRIENLRYATFAENFADCKEHGTAPLGESVHTAKLKNSEIPEIRARLAAGESMRSIAKIYNVSANSISAIRDRRQWSHIQ